jgi:hypothetical protein
LLDAASIVGTQWTFPADPACSGELPSRQATTGLPHTLQPRNQTRAMLRPGGFGNDGDYLGGRVRFQPSSAANVVIPDLVERSWLPVPIACEMPNPAWWIWQVNSCSPVPEGPMAPIVPRRTALANPTPTR